MREFVLAKLRRAVEARGSDDTVFALALLDAEGEVGASLVGHFQRIRDEGRFPLATRAALGSFYRKRGMVDLGTLMWLQMLEYLKADEGESDG